MLQKQDEMSQVGGRGMARKLALRELIFMNDILANRQIE